MIANQRIQQINEVIKQELNQIILREVEFDFGSLVTITRTKTDPELKITKIFFRVFPEDKEKKCLRIFKKRSPFLQSLLNKKVILRYVPQIKFFIDTEIKGEEEKEERIEELFRKIEG